MAAEVPLFVPPSFRPISIVDPQKALPGTTTSASQLRASAPAFEPSVAMLPTARQTSIHSHSLTPPPNRPTPQQVGTAGSRWATTSQQIGTGASQWAPITPSTLPNRQPIASRQDLGHTIQASTYVPPVARPPIGVPPMSAPPPQYFGRGLIQASQLPVGPPGDQVRERYPDYSPNVVNVSYFNNVPSPAIAISPSSTGVTTLSDPPLSCPRVTPSIITASHTLRNRFGGAAGGQNGPKLRSPIVHTPLTTTGENHTPSITAFSAAAAEAKLSQPRKIHVRLPEEPQEEAMTGDVKHNLINVDKASGDGQDLQSNTVGNATQVRTNWPWRKPSRWPGKVFDLHLDDRDIISLPELPGKEHFPPDHVHVELPTCSAWDVYNQARKDQLLATKSTHRPNEGEADTHDDEAAVSLNESNLLVHNRDSSSVPSAGHPGVISFELEKYLQEQLHHSDQKAESRSQSDYDLLDDSTKSTATRALQISNASFCSDSAAQTIPQSGDGISAPAHVAVFHQGSHRLTSSGERNPQSPTIRTAPPDVPDFGSQVISPMPHHHSAISLSMPNAGSPFASETLSALGLPSPWSSGRRDDSTSSSSISLRDGLLQSARSSQDFKGPKKPYWRTLGPGFGYELDSLTEESTPVTLKNDLPGLPATPGRDEIQDDLRTNPSQDADASDQSGFEQDISNNCEVSEGIDLSIPHDRASCHGKLDDGDMIEPFETNLQGSSSDETQERIESQRRKEVAIQEKSGEAMDSHFVEQGHRGATIVDDTRSAGRRRADTTDTFASSALLPLTDLNFEQIREDFVSNPSDEEQMLTTPEMDRLQQPQSAIDHRAISQMDHFRDQHHVVSSRADSGRSIGPLDTFAAAGTLSGHMRLPSISTSSFGAPAFRESAEEEHESDGRRGLVDPSDPQPLGHKPPKISQMSATAFTFVPPSHAPRLPQTWLSSAPHDSGFQISWEETYEDQDIPGEPPETEWEEERSRREEQGREKRLRGIPMRNAPLSPTRHHDAVSMISPAFTPVDETKTGGRLSEMDLLARTQEDTQHFSSSDYSRRGHRRSNGTHDPVPAVTSSLRPSAPPFTPTWAVRQSDSRQPLIFHAKWPTSLANGMAAYPPVAESHDYSSLPGGPSFGLENRAVPICKPVEEEPQRKLDHVSHPEAESKGLRPHSPSLLLNTGVIQKDEEVPVADNEQWTFPAEDFQSNFNQNPNLLTGEILDDAAKFSDGNVRDQDWYINAISTRIEESLRSHITSLETKISENLHRHFSSAEGDISAGTMTRSPSAPKSVARKAVPSYKSPDSQDCDFVASLFIKFKEDLASAINSSHSPLKASIQASLTAVDRLEKKMFADAREIRSYVRSILEAIERPDASDGDSHIPRMIEAEFAKISAKIDFEGTNIAEKITESLTLPLTVDLQVEAVRRAIADHLQPVISSVIDQVSENILGKTSERTEELSKKQRLDLGSVTALLEHCICNQQAVLSAAQQISGRQAELEKRVDIMVKDVSARASEVQQDSEQRKILNNLSAQLDLISKKLVTQEDNDIDAIERGTVRHSVSASSVAGDSQGADNSSCEALAYQVSRLEKILTDAESKVKAMSTHSEEQITARTLTLVSEESIRQQQSLERTLNDWLRDLGLVREEQMRERELAEQTKQDLSERLRRAEAEVREARQINQEYLLSAEASRKSCEEEVKEAYGRCARYEGEIASLHKRIADQDGKVASLQAITAAQKQKTAEAQQKLAEAAKLKADFDNQRDQLVLATTRLCELEQSSVEKEELEKRLQVAESIRARLRSEIEECHNQFVRLERDMFAMKANVVTREELVNAERELAKAREEVATLKGQMIEKERNNAIVSSVIARARERKEQADAVEQKAKVSYAAKDGPLALDAPQGFYGTDQAGSRAELRGRTKAITLATSEGNNSLKEEGLRNAEPTNGANPTHSERAASSVLRSTAATTRVKAGGQRSLSGSDTSDPPTITTIGKLLRPITNRPMPEDKPLLKPVLKGEDGWWRLVED